MVDREFVEVAEGIMSSRLSDGVSQEVVVDPNITVGTRKELTEMDLAFLRDIGFETIPEPSGVFLAAMGFFSLIAYGWRRRRVA